MSPAKVISGHDVEATLLFFRLLAYASSSPLEVSRKAAQEVKTKGVSEIYRQSVRARIGAVTLQALTRGMIIRQGKLQNKGGEIDLKSQCRDDTSPRASNSREGGDEHRKERASPILSGEPSLLKELSESPVSSYSQEETNGRVQMRPPRINDECIMPHISEDEMNSRPFITSSDSRNILEKEMTLAHEKLETHFSHHRLVVGNERHRQLSILQERLFRYRGHSSSPSTPLESIRRRKDAKPPFSAPSAMYVSSEERTKTEKRLPLMLNSWLPQLQHRPSIPSRAAEITLMVDKAIGDLPCIYVQEKNEHKMRMRKLLQKEERLKKRMGLAKEEEEELKVKEERLSKLADNLRKRELQMKKREDAHALLLCTGTAEQSEEGMELNPPDRQAESVSCAQCKAISDMTKLRRKLDNRESIVKKREERLNAVLKKLKRKEVITRSMSVQDGVSVFSTTEPSKGGSRNGSEHTDKGKAQAGLSRKKSSDLCVWDGNRSKKLDTETTPRVCNTKKSHTDMRCKRVISSSLKGNEKDNLLGSNKMHRNTCGREALALAYTPEQEPVIPSLHRIENPLTSASIVLMSKKLQDIKPEYGDITSNATTKGDTCLQGGSTFLTEDMNQDDSAEEKPLRRKQKRRRLECINHPVDVLDNQPSSSESAQRVPSEVNHEVITSGAGKRVSAQKAESEIGSGSVIKSHVAIRYQAYRFSFDREALNRPDSRRKRSERKDDDMTESISVCQKCVVNDNLGSLKKATSKFGRAERFISSFDAQMDTALSRFDELVL